MFDGDPTRAFAVGLRLREEHDMDEIRIGVVGSGGMGRRRTEGFSATEGFRVVALAARNPETGPALAEAHGLDLETDWRSMVARTDLDAVVIATHNEIHGEIALAALDAGKHVFTEYPISRFASEADRLAEKARSSRCVLRTAHREPVSAAHQGLKGRIESMGPLMLSTFHRLTPGRGARPEVLFNLNLSGPPALFFVYHVYPMVDLFGPAAWVEGGAKYTGLRDDGGYDAFANTLTVGFSGGGIGQWIWAGGVEIEDAEESQRIVLEGGTLCRDAGGWRISTREATEDATFDAGAEQTLEQRFLQDIRDGDEAWRADTLTAVEAARIGIAAEQSVAENRRIMLADAT